MTWRRLLVLLGVAALVVYVWLAVQVYRSQTDPEEFQAWDGPGAWIVGPPPGPSLEAAKKHIEDGLVILQDVSVPPSERIEGYRRHLRAADALLVRSLRAQPAQARALSLLAAARWELDPPQTEEATARHLQMVAVASQMAPRVPLVQMGLGKLLLNMGRPGEALRYFSRVVELEPAYSREVVGILDESAFSADAILAGLPADPLTLAALEFPFAKAGREEDYLEVIEPVLDDAPAPLLVAYGDACIKAGEPERLLRRTSELKPRDDVEAGAELLLQRSRAFLALGENESALEAAREARSLHPEDPRLGEHLGYVASMAGHLEEALRAYRETLAQVARGRSSNPIMRATLYRRIGQALDREGKPHLAYDAYKNALQLNPDEPHSKRRVAEMERAAGVRAESE